jgi:hypothetical protein
MKKLVLFMSILIFTCCGKTAAKKPSGLISEDQMVEILFDIMLINSAKGVNKRLLENNIDKPTTYIYRSHGIDSLQFAQSNSYYTHNSDLYKSIYERVETKLKAEKSAYEALADERKRIKDSISKSKLNIKDTSKIYYQKVNDNKIKLPVKKLDKSQI